MPSVSPRAHERIDARAFYAEYHGHTLEHLERLAKELPQGRAVVYLVGDSSLDNKHWILSSRRAACNGYEKVLEPTQSVADVCYWINRECERRGLGDTACCINAAIEESTLGLRSSGALLPQDTFVRQHVGSGDVIVCSCGGNDIALRPTVWTALSMFTLLLCPTWMIQAGIAPGLGHFVRLFRGATEHYLANLIGQSRPRAIVACMLYYLDVRTGGSWADTVLQKLGYDSDPSKLQLVMRKVYELATSRIAVRGVPVVPVALYEALDGTDTHDYVQRVEPSSQGGEKMARLIVRALEGVLEQSPPAAAEHTDAATPTDAPDASRPVSMPAAVHVHR